MLTILSQMLPQFDFSEIRFKIHTEKCTSNVTLPKSVGSDPTPPQEQFWEMRKKSEITHLSPFLTQNVTETKKREWKLVLKNVK